MDKKSKILLYVFLVLIIISVILTYYRTMVALDYPVMNITSTVSDTNLNFLDTTL